MRWNNVVGVITGLFTLVPYDQWRRDHAIHHASSGDLDRRGHGDITTITVREYLALTPFKRWQYRMYRHPLVLLFGGPFFLLFTLRFRAKGKGTHRRQVWSLWLTNVAIVGLLATVVLAWGWRALAVYGIAYYLAMSAGVWLFYVQHQFEDAYWEAHPDWDYETSAMRGSSHLRLPAPLRWLTASIGVHHIHHLAPKIPNYRLQKCYDENPRLQSAPIMTVGAGLAALRLALWDEERRRLVRFSDVRQAA
jgi:omega-6 fatty acid desaturase (delta-12 desaturase)